MQAVQESCKKELSPPLCCPGDKPHFQKWILKSEFVFEIEYFKELNKKDYFKIKGFVLVKNPWSKFYIFKPLSRTFRRIAGRREGRECEAQLK
jgi:hypothetical protein